MKKQAEKEKNNEKTETRKLVPNQPEESTLKQ